MASRPSLGETPYKRRSLTINQANHTAELAGSSDRRMGRRRHHSALLARRGTSRVIADIEGLAPTAAGGDFQLLSTAQTSRLRPGKDSAVKGVLCCSRARG